jgi:hypothetical protein
MNTPLTDNLEVRLRDTPASSQYFMMLLHARAMEQRCYEIQEKLNQHTKPLYDTTPPVNLIHNGVGIADMYTQEEYEAEMQK